MRGKTNKNRMARSVKELRGQPRKKRVLKVKANSSELKKEAKLESKSRKIKRSEDYPSAKEVINRVRTEREKKLFMWTGVSFIMVIIVVFWVINTRAMMLHTTVNDSDTNLNDIWKETQIDFEAGIQGFQNDMELIKKATETADNEAIIEDQSALSPEVEVSLPENLDIEELDNQ